MSKGDSKFVASVPKHEKGRVLTANYLSKLEESVKGRTPIGGANISITYLDGGAVISVTGSSFGQPLVLNVCSNGVPSVVTVASFE